MDSSILKTNTRHKLLSLWRLLLYKKRRSLPRTPYISLDSITSEEVGLPPRAVSRDYPATATRAETEPPVRRRQRYTLPCLLPAPHVPLPSFDLHRTVARRR